MTFGEKLKELKKAAGMTLAAIAEATEIGLQTVKDYEGNRRTPSLQNAKRHWPLHSELIAPPSTDAISSTHSSD